MKRGLCSILPIQIGMNLDEVKRIEFIFKQGDTKLQFDYPSENAKRGEGNTVNLYWNRDQTYKFCEGMVKMDTRISVSGSAQNPETEVISFKMNETLFKEGD